MKGRRAARALAFQVLFEMAVREELDLEAALESRVKAMEEDADEPLDEESVRFARDLVEGTIRHRSELDRRIHAVAPAFPIDQMPSVERVCLELGAGELTYERSTSVPIIINEAVELAKTYGGANSGRFVNGVLGTIAEELAGEPAGAPPPHANQNATRR